MEMARRKAHTWVEKIAHSLTVNPPQTQTNLLKKEIGGVHTVA
jgi:hypothetical protein